MTNPNDPFAYERSQLDRLGAYETYRVKIVSEAGETKWLVLSADQFRAVYSAILGPGEVVWVRTGV